MDSEFEVIRYSGNLPARIELLQDTITVALHWHKEIELVYVMDGEVDISVSNRTRSLASDSFVLINSAENHSLSSQAAKCLILDISYEFAPIFNTPTPKKQRNPPIECGFLRFLPSF